MYPARIFPRHAGAPLTVALLALLSTACGGRDNVDILTGDWEWYQMLGATPTGGFEAQRRFAFAHFDGTDPAKAWVRRRSGETMADVLDIGANGDSITIALSGAGNAL